MKIIAHALRAWIRMCRTQRAQLAAPSRILLGFMMVPAFSLLLIILRTASALGVRMRMKAITMAGDEFMCHPPDLIQMYIWLFGIWEPDLTHFIVARLKPGDGFIDVGANIGYYSVLASRCVGTTGKVAAIEASPSAFSALLENLDNNPHCTNVRSINKAAAAKAGTISVYAGPQHNTGLTTTVPTRGLPAQTTIEALPLDDLLTLDEIRNARLVKIDVEGGEPSVLAGMSRFLQHCRGDVEILLELSPNWWSDPLLRPIDVLQPFIDAGFNIFEMENNYWPWRYLWPNCVSRPKRTQRDLTRRNDRIDLVLSKQGVPAL